MLRHKTAQLWRGGLVIPAGCPVALATALLSAKVRGQREAAEAEVKQKSSEKRWNGGLLGFANKLKPKVDKENNFEQNSYTYSFLFCKANMFYKKLVDMILWMGKRYQD